MNCSPHYSPTGNQVRGNKKRPVRRQVFFVGKSGVLGLDVLVDGGGGSLACAHGQDDGGGAGDGVTAGEHALTGGLALLIGDQAAVLVGLQALGGHAQQRVGAGAQGVDHGVHLQHEVGVGHGIGPAATPLVGLAQLHADALDAGDIAVLVADDLHRIGEQLELHFLLHGVVDLLLTGGDLLHAAAVDDVDLLGAHALGAAGGIHGHVAGANDGDLLVVLDGGVVIVPVGLHQVDAGQVLVGGVHAQQALAGDAQEPGQTGTGAQEHGLEALVGEQLVHGDGPADDGVGDHLHAQSLQPRHFPGHDGLGQTELGDAVNQHAAGLVEQLVNGDVVAHAGQVARAGQTGGAGAHHRHPVTVAHGLLWLGGLIGVGGVPVGHEPLQAADAHALALLAPDALALALVLLGADPAAHGGQGVGGGDDLVCLFKFAGGDPVDELGDPDVHRAALHAQRLLALEAASGLVHGHLLGVAQGHLFKVLVAYQRLLLRHGVLGHAHIRLSHVLHLR